jgi:hypothetical protein
LNPVNQAVLQLPQSSKEIQDVHHATVQEPADGANQRAAVIGARVPVNVISAREPGFLKVNSVPPVPAQASAIPVKAPGNVTGAMGTADAVSVEYKHTGHFDFLLFLSTCRIVFWL